MALPIKNGKVGTPFGKKGDAWKSGKHEGVDFPAKAGTDILACADGKVIGVGIWGKAYGDHGIVIKHNLGTKLKPKTVYAMYAHGSKALVKTGDKVVKGQHIGEVGHEGNAFGDHLHLEVQAKPTWTFASGIDPKELLEA